MALVRLHHSPLHLLLDAGCGVRWEGLAKRWICGIIWVCEKKHPLKHHVAVESWSWAKMNRTRKPWRNCQIFRWHQLTDFQALIVNVAGEDFCYTFHEMRERPVKINSNLQEDRGNNPTKILIIHIHLYHSYVVLSVWQLLCTGWCNSPPKARGKVGITFSLSTSNIFNQPA